MIDFDKNKLIGIPFKLNGKSFEGCDCRGIVYLYHKCVHGLELPFSDGGMILFRNKKKDIERITKICDEVAKKISFNELKEGDIAILKVENSIGSLGVCTDNKYVLCMNRIIGSCRIKIEYLKEIFLYGYRLNEKIL